MNALEKKDTENRADQKRYTIEVEDLQKDSKVKKDEEDKLARELEKYKEKIPEMEKDSEKLRKAMEKKKKEFDIIDAKVQSETEGTKTELKELEEKKGKLRLKVQKEDNQIERAQEAVESINLEREQREIDNIEQNIVHEKENLEKLEEDYKRICEKYQQSNEKKIKEFEAMIQEAQAEKESLKDEITRLVNEIEEAKNGVGNMNFQEKMLKILLKAQDQGHLSGIHGRLGDLGTIDPKFDIAISNSCPGLNNIVVDTIDDANKVLRYLRENKIGVTKCIALDQTEKSMSKYMNAPFKPPANSERLFNLVKPYSEKYKIAFYSIISNTLVVEDIDIANEVAFGEQRHRVVTLRGEVIERTGVTSGGGKPKRGLISNGKKKRSTTNKDQMDVNSLMDKRQKLTAKVDELEIRILEFQNKIFELRNDETNKEAEAFRERYPVQKRSISSRILRSESELKE